MIKTIQKQVKFQIEDFDAISKKLIELEAVFIGGFFEKTIRYDTDDHRLFDRGIFIRTKSGLRNVLTLKEKTSENDNALLERYTTEIEIDDIEKMEYMLSRIGFTNKVIMEKYRLYFKWNHIEISIDELPFGIYLEIKGDDKEIKKLAKQLGFKNKDMITVTYWDIYDKIKHENSNHIQFDKSHIFKIATY